MKDCQKIKRAYKEYRKPTEANRVNYACEQLEKIGLKPIRVDDQVIHIPFKDSLIIGFPYKGWYTGKAIKDCRGIGPLLRQLKKIIREDNLNRK